ncbi:uncharacterized protein LOC119738570 [Patiria miniata]|uniref:CAP-Gly domain-containing protein n=1 Tax=Patiria miniata TaxID=46514 RepID=A0A914AZ26_PATMI|nr:uncharacterized protein LOC119738570 [Patiria miniata]
MPALPLSKTPTNLLPDDVRNISEDHNDGRNRKPSESLKENFVASEPSFDSNGPSYFDNTSGHDEISVNSSAAPQDRTNVKQLSKISKDTGHQASDARYIHTSQELSAEEGDISLLLDNSSSNESYGKVKRGNSGALLEKKLSIISVRDSELDLIGLTHDGGSRVSDITKEAVLTEPNQFSEATTSSHELILSSSTKQDHTSTEKLQSNTPASQSNNIQMSSSTKPPSDSQIHHTTEQLPSSSSPQSSAKPRARQCCGGHGSARSDNASRNQQQGQGISKDYHVQLNTPPKTMDASWMDSPTSNGHTGSPSTVATLDSSTLLKGNYKKQQGGGLFEMLLTDNREAVELELDCDSNTDGKMQGDNQVTMAASGTSGEELTPRHPSAADQQPAPKKRRKTGRRTLCADPFAKLPKVKLRPFVWTEDSDDEMSCEIVRQKRKLSAKRSPRSVNRHSRQFEDPFKELAFVVFDSADVDCDKRLRRAEFASILKSPTLDLELSAEDIRKLEKDCSKGRKDIRNLPVSFDEFLPLARNLLLLYYNKQDADSRNPWSILDRGRDHPPYYFNKNTGDVSSDRPVDYDNQPELFLFEKALQDTFETADMDKDGRIHLNDFIRIINSDLSLILTKRDIAEITNHFRNEAGKVDKVSYGEFLPLAKRLVVAVFSARDSIADDWSFLHSRNVGAFWFNKRTGQSCRHAPNHIVTMQQQQLRHRKHEGQALLKATEELKVTKAKLEDESTLRKDFEEKYTSLSSEHAITSRELQKMERLYDKCRAESEKKSIMLDANEKEKTKLLHKIEQLEERVADAERTETNLDSVRDVLRNCQGALREHELDIMSLQAKIDDLSKQLSESESKVEEGQGVIADLHRQLREEIKRNEKMETELKKVPDIKKELQEEKETLQLCQKKLEERNAVLTLTRQVNRENKTKIKTLETELSKLPSVEEELEIAQCEIYTLKQLIVGKDSLVAQKSQELDSVKERLDRGMEGGAGSGNTTRGRGTRNGYPPNGVNYRVIRLQKRSSKSMQVGARSKENKPSYNSSRIDISTPPYDSSSSSSQSECKHQRLNDCHPDDEDVVATSVNASNGGLLRLLQKQGSVEEDEPTIYDLYTPEGSYMPTSKTVTPCLKNGANPRPKSSMARLGAEESSIMQKGTVMFEDDFLVAQCLQVGDRVRIKKKGGKRGGTIQSGIVKFIGKVDKEYNHNDHRLYAGIRLDEAEGDTDGVIKGKRYFTVNPRHGKLVPITSVVAVLNPKTSTYKRISESIRAQQFETGAVRYEKGRNAQLIRVK